MRDTLVITHDCISVERNGRPIAMKLVTSPSEIQLAAKMLSGNLSYLIQLKALSIFYGVTR